MNFKDFYSFIWLPFRRMGVCSKCEDLSEIANSDKPYSNFTVFRHIHYYLLKIKFHLPGLLIQTPSNG